MVVDEGVESRRPQDVAAEHGHRHAHEGEHAAEDIPYEVLLDPEPGRREVEVEGIGLVEPKLEGADGGGNEQEQKAPEEEEVHQTGVQLALDESPVCEDVEGGQPHGPLDAGTPGAQVDVGPTEAPDPDAAREAPGDGGRCDDQ